MKRKSISKKRRFDIFKRDSFRCQYCGDTPPNALLHVDHIVPVKNGGQNDPDNLITSCQRCNLGKGACGLDAIPQSLSEKAAEVKEREAQIAEYNKILMASRDRIASDTWQVANEFLRIVGATHGSIHKMKYASIKRFVEIAGLHACLDAMDVMECSSVRGEDRSFRYFCGVMWGKIREMGEI